MIFIILFINLIYISQIFIKVQFIFYLILMQFKVLEKNLFVYIFALIKFSIIHFSTNFYYQDYPIFLRCFKVLVCLFIIIFKYFVDQIMNKDCVFYQSFLNNFKIFMERYIYCLYQYFFVRKFIPILKILNFHYLPHLNHQKLCVWYFDFIQDFKKNLCLVYFFLNSNIIISIILILCLIFNFYFANA